MDLEHLTKHQILLLTLLVSFVTSIATGIVTVSLMDQAPTSVTRTINQIVEHTVETVVPASQGAAVVVTEKTVVVKDDDLAAQSIAKVRSSIVRIAGKGGDLLISRGVIIDAQGTVITDRGALEQSGAKDFEAILPSGKRVAATLLKVSTTTAVALLSLDVGTTTLWGPAALAEQSKLQLGQSVIRIGGTGGDTVGTGVIASLPQADRALIQASVSSATPGSLLMTLFGEVIGIITTKSALEGADFYSIPELPQPATSP